MNAPSVSHVTAWLAQRPLREQRLLTVLALLASAAFIWLLAIAPAWQTYRESSHAHATLDAQLATMQAMAHQAQQLKALTPTPRAQAKTWLEASIGQLGKASASTEGQRVLIHFEGATSEALAAWLAQTRTSVQLQPVQANWTRTGAPADAPPLWSGTLLFELDAQ